MFTLLIWIAIPVLKVVELTVDYPGLAIPVWIFLAAIAVGRIVLSEYARDGIHSLS